MATIDANFKLQLVADVRAAQVSGMEIRAREDIPMFDDLTPPIPPIAASLYDKFLPSHCSSCFLPLPPSSSYTSVNTSSTNPLLSCSACSASVKYCSTECAAADYDRHFSTGECRLFTLRPPSPAEDTADARVALRLIHLFERLGLLPCPSSRSDSPQRIGWLLAGGLAEVMDEGGELAERVRGGAALMSRARNPGMVESCWLEKVSIEEEVLWAVMTNAVEVEIGEFGGIGLAVYGPCFSWFNHSCVPNACYRFELSSRFEASRPCDLGSFKVSPAGGTGEALNVWKTWKFGLCWFGPRIIVRNIKPLNKEDEVCIAYTDLLQPKAARHFDLWSRYRFVCHCERCCISPQMYIDYILSCDARSLNLENHCHNDSEWMDVSDYLEEAIAEYMLDGNPELCSAKLENMLCDSFHCKSSDALESRFRLHPLHFLSLKTFIALSSAYRIQACNVDFIDLSADDVYKNFKMARAAVACSLLIACATHHLFMCETSIIPNTALFWIGAAESILYLIRIARSLTQSVGKSFSLTFVGFHFTIEGQPRSQEDLLAVSAWFIDHVSLIMINLWPFFAQGHSYLECIENPANFCLLLITNSNQSHNDERNAGYDRQEFSGSKYGGREYIVEWNGLHQLVVSCITYGRYLANLCHGTESHLSKKVGELECILKESML